MLHALRFIQERQQTHTSQARTPVLSYYITTASTCSPSCSCTSSLVVSPSLLRCAPSRRVVCSTKPASSAAAATFGKSGTSCQLDPGCRMRWLLRGVMKGGQQQALHKRCVSERRQPRHESAADAKAAQKERWNGGSGAGGSLEAGDVLGVGACRLKRLRHRLAVPHALWGQASPRRHGCCCPPVVV